MAGELIAAAIADGDDRWRLFAPYELVWAGGAIGREVTRVVHWMRRMREAALARAARRRDALRNGHDATGTRAGDQNGHPVSGPAGSEVKADPPSSPARAPRSRKKRAKAVESVEES
jgi:hypothetical protein